MPAVYGLVRLVEFRWALAILVLAFVFAVTSLTIIPIVTTTRENIQAESIRRAKTIARNMRDTNKRYIIEKNEIAMDIRAAELEEGVTAALIISAKEGTILAPANKRGEFANRPFVNKARRDDREVAEFIDDSTVGVAIPISFYNPETGNQSAAAFAIVIYDTGALVMNSNQVLSLYIQTLAIGLLVGLVLFFLLFKIVEHPIEVANFQLDDALREGRDDLQIDYKFEVLEKFLANINSALSRIGRPTDSNGALAPIVNRDIEASNVVRMLPVPAMTINALDDRIVSTNVAFDRLVGGGVSLQGRPVTDIPDPSLPLQLAELLPRMRESVSEIAISQIPFPEGQFEIRGQTILGGSEPAYYLITLNKTGVDGG
jgi:hypothetical protein